MITSTTLRQVADVFDAIPDKLDKELHVHNGIAIKVGMQVYVLIDNRDSEPSMVYWDYSTLRELPLSDPPKEVGYFMAEYAAQRHGGKNAKV